ncbi:hypothetical protein FC093_22490 [Ilyomonas limi]|uniref:Uncharacterized protein n=1 Tax=Ilyomonas limi TaxID=2575867 RepID=A0A4U3KS67_9BACT|nr:hypothetical protein [Ilyomonas limi]TKK64479.1 hypothetical protein FC093_22490 [Ilyomonas limi]
MINILFRFLAIPVLLFTVTSSLSQQDRRFKGRLVLLDGNQKLLKDIGVRLVDQGSGVTGTDGEFAIAISNKAASVTLDLVNSNWEIVYPIGGKISVPKDTNEVVDFIVGDSPKTILTQALAKSNNEIKSSLSKLGVKQDGIEAALTEFRNEIQVMSNIKLEDLKDQIDLANKREQFYPVLTSAINNYINEAKDLKDAFKFIARHAFDDNEALQVLTGAVNSYSAAYEDINNKHSGYEKMVDDLWNSESKSSEVRDFFKYALGELHSANIFTLNLKIRDINDYNRGNFKGPKKAFKEAILREIESSDLQLERRLEELDNRAQVVITKLAG